MQMALHKNKFLTWVLLLAVMVSFVLSPLMSGNAQAAGTSDLIIAKLNSMKAYADDDNKQAFDDAFAAWASLDANDIDAIATALATTEAATKTHLTQQEIKNSLTKLVLEFDEIYSAVGKRAAMQSYYDDNKLFFGNMMAPITPEELWVIAQMMQTELPNEIKNIFLSTVPEMMKRIEDVEALLPLIGGTNNEIVKALPGIVQIALTATENKDADFKKVLEDLGWDKKDFLTGEGEKFAKLIDSSGDAQIAAMLIFLRSEIELAGADGLNITKQAIDNNFISGTLNVPNTRINSPLDIGVLLGGISIVDIEARISTASSSIAALDPDFAQLLANRKFATWESSDPSVVNVVNGKLVPLKAGTAVITLNRFERTPTANPANEPWLYKFKIEVTGVAPTYDATFNVVADATGLPINQASVSVDSGAAVLTDALGNATVKITAGPHRYSVSASGYNNAAADFTMPAANESYSVRLTVRTGTGGGGGGSSTSYAARFTVVDAADQTPINGATVSVDTRTATTDASGIATISGLTRNSSYDATVTMTGYTDAIANFTVDATTVDVSVEMTRLPLAGTEHIRYISGRDGNRVEPDANITRAEAAMIFFNTSDRTNAAPAQAGLFSDVDVNAWYAQAVTNLVNRGVITGYSDGTFMPDKFITRAELTVLASKYAGLDLTNLPENQFSDFDSSFWAANYILAAVGQGWIVGYPNDTRFMPDNNITRAETIVIVNRLLDRKVDRSSLITEGIHQFADLQDSHWAYADIMEAANTHEYTKEDTAQIETWTKIAGV